MSIPSTAVTPDEPKKHIMGEESSNMYLKRRHQNRIAQRRFCKKARARVECMSQTARASANTPFETMNETQSYLGQSFNNIFSESASPSAIMAFEEHHDSFQIPDLDPGFCNLFPEDQLNDSAGGINMSHEYQFETHPSHNLWRRSIMNGNHTMDNGDNLMNAAGDENESETENHSLHAGRLYNNVLLPSDKLHLVDLDVKGQENRENTLATIKKQKGSFQGRGQLLIDDLEELYNFGVSLEILPPDLYFKRLLLATKERFTSLSRAPLGHTYRD